MLVKWLKESTYTVVFTGAGMSTESGVPDFRSNSGLWRGKNPQLFASIDAMKHNREEFIDFYKMRIKLLETIEPHSGYKILSILGVTSKVKSIITQNTDGLHELSDNPNVIPLHGTIRLLHCNDCRTVYPSEKYLRNEIQCKCGGFIRPSVVLFGEMLDDKVLAEAEKETRKADLYIVLGSSLVVSPANWYPRIAKEHGAKLVIVNSNPTPLDPLADLIINDRKIGKVLEQIYEELVIK